ncbi:MAG: flagellar motor protein MotB [Bacillota bacterium]|nr:flagellar motor protein MotB [Bacillota bacterium]
MGFNSRKHNDVEEDSSEDWLTTYSDLVTLLLAFFVLLFSFSEIDAKKWEELVKSFTGDFIITESSTTDSFMDNNTSILEQNNIDIREQLMEIRQQQREMEAEEEELEEELEEEVQEDLEEEIPEEDLEEEIPEEELEEEIEENEVEVEAVGNQADQEVIDEEFEELYSELIQYNDLEGLELEIARTDSEIRIRLSNNLLFSPEEADIYENSTETLREIVNIIKSYDETLDAIVMEGNTDDLPITTGRYRDNFELSIERALNVLYFFRYEGDFQPEKLIPMGYGEYNPVATNETAEGRAKNRRTDILLIKSSDGS